MPERPRLVVAVTSSISTSLMRGQLAYMRERGFDVYFLCSGDDTARQFCEREGATLLDVPMQREISPLADLKSLAGIVRALRKVRPHLVNAGTPKAGLLVTLGAWLAGVPCRIYNIRGLRLETTSGRLRAILTLCEKIAARLAHRVLCISPSLLRLCRELNLFPQGKGKVLGEGSSNGLDTDRFTRTPEIEHRARQLRQEYGIPPKARVLGFVGRIVRDKGIVELVDAWRSLREDYADLHLLVVGPFEAGDPAPAETREVLEKDPRVHLTGHVNDMPPYYAAMDILAVPTYREGFGNVFVEASAMEVPAVGTQVSGCMDAIADGVTGTLVPPRNSEALAKAIRAYLDDEELASTHARQGRERVLRSFRPEVIWQNLFDEYVALLKSRGLPTPE
ncbi:MAG: glycosyltransferase family 4 protein [Armatimonadetes bacterium]|nr:glycosyltransferase family 4 protein [Armatimonadota bacterium]